MMINFNQIRGVLFDYGGTIDSNGVHWAEVIWMAYQTENLPVSKEVFRYAYVHGERVLGKNPLIKPHHTFFDLMQIKIGIQFEWLKKEQYLTKEKINTRKYRIADFCYNYARASVENASPVIEWIASKYPLVLVSNFYGNMATVLKDFRINHFFSTIIESAVVGVRKPDPQIFRLGVQALHLQEYETVAIGDSYDKDIVPAMATGCKTIWLKNSGWNEYKGNEKADIIISDFSELRKWL